MDFITKPLGIDEVVARVQHAHGHPATAPASARRRALRPSRSAPRPADVTPPRQWPHGARHPGAAVRAGRVTAGDQPGSVFQPGQVVAYRFRDRAVHRERGHGRALRGGGSRTARAGCAQDDPVGHRGGTSVRCLLFKREVHLARQVTHPNVCRIFDVYRHRTPASPARRHRRKRSFSCPWSCCRRDPGGPAPARGTARRPPTSFISRGRWRPALGRRIGSGSYIATSRAPTSCWSPPKPPDHEGGR